MVARKIESLTARQEARFAEFVEAWTRVGLSTDPADRPRAEAAIAEMYRRAGVAPPQKIVWCGSPLSLGLTRATVLDTRLAGTIGAAVPDGIAKSVWEWTKASVSDTGDVAAGYCFSDHLGHKVLMSVQDDVRADVSEDVWSDVLASIRDPVWDNISDAVNVWDSVRAAWVGGWYDTVRQSLDGQHAAVDRFQRIDGIVDDVEEHLHQLIAVAAHAGKHRFELQVDAGFGRAQVQRA